MRAAYLNGHGGNEVVMLGDRPQPGRGRGEVLVRMRAGGLNRVDLYMRNSGAGITHNLPMIMGLDGAGIVEEADPESRFRPGDAVLLYPARTCNRCEFCRRGEDVLCTSVRYLGEHIDGTLCDFVCVPEENLFRKPDHIGWTESASLAVAWLTAWRMIRTKAKVQPWETVLVFGIGGSISLAALQLLHAMGCRTLVTSRDETKLGLARELGADGCLATDDADFSARLLDMTDGRGVDAVIENVGKAVWPLALKALVRGGRLVTCGATSGDDPSADIRRLFIRQLQVFGSTLGNRSEFAELLTIVERRALKPHIDSVFALADLHGALDRLESGAQTGKIAIDLS